MTGEELMILRRRRKLSQAELADMVGIHRNQIGRLERGESNITPEREGQFRRLLVQSTEHLPEEPVALYET